MICAATTKPTKWVRAQRRLRSAWASAQSDQSLRCPHEERFCPSLPIERTAKTLIRLGGCPGWSESSLGAHSLCWFCHVAAHLWLFYVLRVCILWIDVVLIIFIYKDAFKIMPLYKHAIFHIFATCLSLLRAIFVNVTIFVTSFFLRHFARQNIPYKLFIPAWKKFSWNYSDTFEKKKNNNNNKEDEILISL